ncbi:hypothetical protein [Streptomyces canus]|uniref:hypothetical protein n=1 Tax=Streptomyces canus TaxID=58343 RepID=UPI0038700550|nr:hypothetical protein OH824_17765 [Streptomyces canus]
MAHTFEDLVNLQRIADEAHACVLALRADGGEAYDEAWQAWREAAVVVQAAVTEHAKAEEKPRYDIEVAVKKQARHPEPAEA